MKKSTSLVLFCLLILPLLGCAALRSLSAPNRDWAIGAAALYLIPVVMVLIKKTGVRVTGVWLGIFLIAEFTYSVFFFDTNYKTLPPMMNQKFEIVGDVMPGFTGIQHVTTDQMGYRVTREINYENKPDKTLRIFAIGASTTEQIYLDDQKTWTHLLQEKMQEQYPNQTVEVINTGLSGLRAEHHYSTLNRILAYEPDMVLFLIGVNDWNRQIRHTLDARLKQRDTFDPFSPKRSLIGTAIDSIRAKRRAEKVAAKTDPNKIQEVNGAYYASVNHSFNRLEKEIDIQTVSSAYDTVLSLIIQKCKQTGINCVFLTQPHGYRETATEELIERFWMTPPKENYTVGMNAMKQIAALYNTHLQNKGLGAGFPVCDLTNVLEASTLYFYDDCHYNEAGAQQISQAIFLCLKNSSFNQ